MKLNELKDSILNNTLDDSLLIFVYGDNDFLARQYLHEISKLKGQDIYFVETFEELASLNSNDDVFGEELEKGVLKVFEEDTLDIIASNSLSSLENSIIMCKEIAKEVAHTYEPYQNKVIKFQKPEEWQIKDYIKINCTGLSKEHINKLYVVTGGDIYRIDNEINKIKCFPVESQDYIFVEMLNSGAFSDVIQGNIFTLVNAIVKRDMTTIGNVLRNLHLMNIDAIGLSTILHSNIKNIIDVMMNAKSSPESLNMNPKQYNAIKYNCGKMSEEKLLSLLTFLDEIDFKLKSGYLDISNNDKIDYIVCKMLER